MFTVAYFVTDVVSIRRLARMSQLLDKVPDVDIDGHGRFKYILIDVQDDVGKASKKIVRGYGRAQWHGKFASSIIINIYLYIYLLFTILKIQSVHLYISSLSWIEKRLKYLT